MQGRKLQHLVDSCAEMASQGKRVTSFVILYQTKDGSINWHRGGQASSQVGILEIAKTGVINGLTGSGGCDE